MANKKSRLAFGFIAFTLLLTGCGNNQNSSSSSSEDTTSNITPPSDYEIGDYANDGGTFYEVFVRAFADSNQDGIGDLNGVKNKISYLKTLGISGLWLMPINPSPSYHGYNVSNYYGIESDYGTLNDFENLVSVANDNDISIIIDLVINHSGSDNPYFQKSAAYVTGINRSAENEPYADWYTWHEGEVTPSENLKGTYRRYQSTNWYYLANFDSSMPDFNLDSEGVRSEITNIAYYWLDKGVRGFRLDATTWFYENDHQKNIQFLSWFNTMVKSHKSDAYIVGEAWLDSADYNKLPDYYASGVDSFFYFAGSQSTGAFATGIQNTNGEWLASTLESYYNQLFASNSTALNASFLSNHDQDRSSGYAAFYQMLKRKLGASVYLLTPGIPYLYYGEEIGLKGSGADENKRLPMIWSELDKSEECTPVSGYTYDLSRQVTAGATDLLAENFSLLNHYRKVISIRNRYPGIQRAHIEALDLGRVPLMGIKLTEASLPDGEIVIVHNFNSESQTFSTNLTIADEIDTSEIRPLVDKDSITLAPYSSVVLVKGI